MKLSRRTLVLIALALSSPPLPAQWTTDSLSEARRSLAATSAGTQLLFAGGYLMAPFVRRQWR